MADRVLGLPDKNGPFKYDVYLGCGVLDLTSAVNGLREMLERRDILCFPKYDPAHSQQGTKSAIIEGVARSRKCLLYVSPSFIEDKWYKMEVAEVVNKAKRFSRDMVVVLKHPQLASVPSELSEYGVLNVHDDDTLKNPEFLNGLADALKKGMC